MTEFQAYLWLGFGHITDVKGYDHIIFILALCAVYQLSDWRKVLILVTAFTIGHSIPLAFATLNIFIINKDLIEFLIPVTILLTALTNLSKKLPETENSRKKDILRYLMALFFGLIHGLGFSNFLRNMTQLMNPGEDIITKLLAFNIGLEIGQILIVFAILICSLLFTARFRYKSHDWNTFLSGAAAGIALILILQSEMLNLLI